MDKDKDKLRIDKYLWAIRVFKTRTLAATACDQGKVRLAGSPVKASRQVHIGDVYDIRTDARKWVIEVTGLLHNRVQYQEAVKYYADLTPEEEKTIHKHQAAVFYTGKRKSKIGRPTKKQRRDLDEFTAEDPFS